jgi:uncharacterized phage-associated protein
MIRDEHITTLQALHYMLRRLGGPTQKLKLIKLSYLADKYHLLHFGRTITRDGFRAMKLGPVGSNALNLLSLNEDFLGQETIAHAIQVLDVNGLVISPKGESEYEYLSDSDKAAIDFIVEKFGGRTGPRLVDYLHQFPEWTRFQSKLQDDPMRAFKIEELDIFSVPNDDLAISPEQAELTKEHFLGHF